VKIDTLAGLMEKMGYAADSAEFQGAGSAVALKRPAASRSRDLETVATARRQIAAFPAEAEQNCRKLAAAVVDAALSADQISLLVYAARRPDVLAIIGAVQKWSKPVPARKSRPSSKWLRTNRPQAKHRVASSEHESAPRGATWWQRRAASKS